MTRSELIDALSERFPQLVRQDAELTVTEIFAAISRTLAEGGRVEIRGFGSFCLNYRAPRIGRNPKTGEKVSVPGKYVPQFRAGKELRELVCYSQMIAQQQEYHGSLHLLHTGTQNDSRPDTR